MFGQLRGDVGQLNVVSWLGLITAEQQHTWPGTLFRDKDLFGFGVLTV